MRCFTTRSSMLAVQAQTDVGEKEESEFWVKLGENYHYRQGFENSARKNRFLRKRRKEPEIMDR